MIFWKIGRSFLKKPRKISEATLQLYHDCNTGRTAGVYRRFAALGAAEIDEMIDWMIDDSEFDIAPKKETALYLSLYSYGCGDRLPDRLFEFLLRHNLYGNDGSLYLRAGEKIARILMKRLSRAANSHEASGLTAAIAATGLECAKDFLLQSSRQKPDWTKLLLLPPLDFTQCGGWTVDARTNQLISLCPDAIVPFEPCDAAESSENAPCRSLEERCGFCGRSLILVFHTNEMLATCPICTCYGTLFTREQRGRIYWHPGNRMSNLLREKPDRMGNPSEMPNLFANYHMKPTAERRRPTYTANQFTEITRTQLGGMPTPINDAHYPRCPDCRKLMCFAGQLDCADFGDEGIYYFYTCEGCRTRATSYEQT